MIITKILETTVDLFDSRDIYNSDISTMLSKKLIERYQNKCFQSMLITDIVKIIRYSDIKIVDNRLDGAAYIDVQFEAKGIILTRGEVLNGCKVTEVISTGIIIEHNHASGLILAGTKQQIFNIIKKSQIIPIIVKEVRYNPGQNEISILGNPFIPQIYKNIYYNIKGNINQEEIEKLNNIFNSFQEEINLHFNISKEKSYEFFRELIYPFKTQQKFEISKFGSKFSSLTFDEKMMANIKNGCIVAPVESQKNDTFIFHSKVEIKDVPDGTVVNANIYTALSEIINKRLLYLTSLRGLAAQYDTKDKIGELMAYWKVCQSLKE